MKTIHAIMPIPVKLMPIAMPMIAFELRLLEPVGESEVSDGDGDCVVRKPAGDGRAERLVPFAEEVEVNADVDADTDCWTTLFGSFVILNVGLQKDSG